MNGHEFAEEGLASTKKEEDKEALHFENGEYNLKFEICQS